MAQVFFFLVKWLFVLCWESVSRNYSSVSTFGRVHTPHFFFFSSFVSRWVDRVRPLSIGVIWGEPRIFCVPIYLFNSFSQCLKFNIEESLHINVACKKCNQFCKELDFSPGRPRLDLWVWGTLHVSLGEDSKNTKEYERKMEGEVSRSNRQTRES